MHPDHAEPTSNVDLRVCIVAENASFRFGGEASLPLHYFSRLRKHGIEAWLVVHSRTRAELEAQLPDEQDRVRYISDQWFHRLIWGLSRFLPRRVSEATFGTAMVLLNQLIQRKMIRKLIRKERVNVVHQPIPVSPKAPSLLYGFGVPVIIGPMNGGMDFPAAFRGAESLFTRVAVAVARSSANLVNSFIPGKQRATILLVANQRTADALPKNIQGQVIEIPENGVDLDIWKFPLKRFAISNPPRFVFVGRLVDWKRLDFVIKALAQHPEALLDVIGDGSMRQQWAAEAATLGIADRIHWLGWRPQPECATILQGATALVLPSIYECGGAVVLEAMACGIPVIATRWGGPADYLNESCGILIDPSNSETIISGFSKAMTDLEADPALGSQLGNAGRKRVEELFDWSRKIDFILEIYRRSIRDFHA